MSGRLRIGAQRRQFWRSRERGAAAVEFGLVLLPLVLVVMAIIQLGWYFYASNAASGAAREGARKVAVGDCWGGFEAFVQSQAPGVITSATYDPALTSATPIGTSIEVTVVADGDLIEFFPWGPANGVVTNIYQVRLEDTDVGSCP